MEHPLKTSQYARHFTISEPASLHHLVHSVWDLVIFPRAPPVGHIDIFRVQKTCASQVAFHFNGKFIYRNVWTVALTVDELSICVVQSYDFALFQPCLYLHSYVHTPLCFGPH